MIQVQKMIRMMELMQMRVLNKFLNNNILLMNNMPNMCLNKMFKPKLFKSQFTNISSNKIKVNIKEDKMKWAKGTVKGPAPGSMGVDTRENGKMGLDMVRAS